MPKVQLTLTEKETAILSDYGKTFGYSLPKTIRFILSKAAETHIQNDIPTYKMNSELEDTAQKALDEDKKGHSQEISDVDEFLDSL